LLVSLVFHKSYGQSVIEKYFPKYQLQESWFEPIEAEWLHNQIVFQNKQYSERRQLRGSSIPFYSSCCLLGSEEFKTGISVAFSRRALNNTKFNLYKLLYATDSDKGCFCYALPFVYISPSVPDFMNYSSDVLLTSYEKQKRFLNHPGRGDLLLDEIEKEGFNREAFLHHFFVSNPSVVDYDWYELPDVPSVMGQSKRLVLNKSARSLGHLFVTDNVRRPDLLEKVDMANRPWVFSGSEHVQFSQAYLKNWVKGGQQSVSLLSDLRFSAIYKDDDTQWENNLIHKIGVIDIEGSNSRINDDLIELSSKYGINASKKWFYSLLFNFKTQFFNGYESDDVEKLEPISAFMAPASWSLAAGMDYKTKNFTLMLSPLTSRISMVLDTVKIDQTRYSIPEDKKSMFFMGGSFQNNLTWNVSEGIELTSAMNVFYDYFEKEDKVQAEWDLILDMKINVFLSTRITTNFRYYESESSKLQARENLSIAFQYKF